MTNSIYHNEIVSENNLTLCQASYFEACWCDLNSSNSKSCHYLLRHVDILSNSSYFCVYHIIKHVIDCYKSSSIESSHQTVSTFYVYCSLVLFIFGLTGNGISIVILLNTKLQRLCIYRNLTILCFLNIFYLISIFIRYKNTSDQDIREISTEFCRLHTFFVAFLGHLSSWQLISTSIQRVHGLLSLQSHQTISWMRTWFIFFFTVFLPLLLFDGQILFNYGIFSHKHICKKQTNEQLRRARKHPSDLSLNQSETIPVIYNVNSIVNENSQHRSKDVCLIWNLIDIFLYTIIPFLITLICSFIIIVKVCQRRRTTVNLGGRICHQNQDILQRSRNHLSTLLITTTILFFLLTSPLNLYLIIQSIFEHVQSKFLIEHLSLLQNAYHSFAFLFYCVIGNKFRNCAKSICRTIYLKFVQYRPMNCCFERRRSSTSANTMSTASRQSDNRRLPLTTHRRATYVTYDVHQKTIGLVHKDEQI